MHMGYVAAMEASRSLVTVVWGPVVWGRMCSLSFVDGTAESPRELLSLVDVFSLSSEEVVVDCGSQASLCHKPS